MALVPFPGSQPAAPSEPADEQGRGDGARMSFLEHLDELRRRLMYSVAAVAAGCLVAFAFIDRLFNFIFLPLQQLLPNGEKLIYTEPTEAFTLYLELALLAGIVLAAPFIMWQVWLFIAPGLYSHEKRFAIPFVLLSSSGFILGALFNHYVLFRFLWVFLASFSSSYVMFTPKLDPMFDLYVKMMLITGLVFQLPTVVFFLAKMGMVTPRFLWKNFKYAILIIFIVAAAVTPSPDPFTQTVVALPMIGLYLMSILIAWMVRPIRGARAQK
ncbi:MAG TPA: twin-arginine translocase subunit TatC [Vicinamibacterales bacterium]|nr:twin-arginine translocase subunit TatC [Vicinamibacterales bacterium]